MPALPYPTGRSRPAPFLAAAGFAITCVAFGVLTAIQPLAVVGLAVLVAGGLISILRPHAVALLGVALLGVVPVYAAPKVGPLDLDPAVLACWGAAAGLGLLVLLGEEKVRPHPLDGAVALYVGLLAVPVLYEVREAGEYLQMVVSILGPYLALRLLVPRVRGEWVPRAFALAALLALPFVLYEFATSTNPFTPLSINAVEAATWTDEQLRFGVRRAEGAFGHAIALSTFCGTVMMLAFGSAALARRPAARWAWVLVLLAAALMLSLTFSRTGWIIFGLGAALIALRVVTGAGRARLLWILAAATALGGLALAALGVEATLVQLFGDERLSSSNNYREILLQRALRGEGLTLVGMRESPLGAGIDAGVVSIDNAYLAIAAEWGYIGGAGLLVVGLAVAYVFWRQPAGPPALLPAVTLANFVGLGSVAIFTQTEFWLWMLVGATAGVHAARLSAPSGPARVPGEGSSLVVRGRPGGQARVRPATRRFRPASPARSSSRAPTRGPAR